MSWRDPNPDDFSTKPVRGLVRREEPKAPMMMWILVAVSFALLVFVPVREYVWNNRLEVVNRKIEGLNKSIDGLRKENADLESQIAELKKRMDAHKLRP